MSTTIMPTLREEEYVKKSLSSTGVAGIPLYVYAVSLASLFTIIGIIWDISWHTSIGRDKFLSPPHLMIYLGAVFGGLFSGIQVLWNSFKSTPDSKKLLVKIWGIFYSSLGALFCIWGAVAMLTSAPFDDWWHNTYGLDVTILSPPHSLLGLGMLFLQFGACVSVTKYINRYYDNNGDSSVSPNQLLILQILFIVAASSLVCMVSTLVSEYMDTRNMRASLFYQVAAVAILLFLPAFGRALRMKWSMTFISIGYFLILGISNWVLQIFHAEPKLGPILNHITHFQPLQFPILFVVPAIGMDILMRRSKKNDWIKAIWMSVIFILLLLLIQYPFSGFLLESPASRNWFFGSESFYFGANPNWEYRYKFWPLEEEPWPVLFKGVAIAILIGILITRLSLRWGKWMQHIQR